jgi:hypothetical protein
MVVSLPRPVSELFFRVYVADADGLLDLPYFLGDSMYLAAPQLERGPRMTSYIPNLSLMDAAVRKRDSGCILSADGDYFRF